MKNKYSFVLLSIIVILSFFLFHFRDQFTTPPWSTAIKLYAPYHVAGDAKGNLVVLDIDNKGQSKLFKIDSNGIIRWKIDCNDRKIGEIYSPSRFTVAGDGTLYVLNDVPNQIDESTERSEIISISADGKKHKVLVQYIYSKEEREQYLESEIGIRNLFLAGEELYFYRYGISNSLTLVKYNKESGVANDISVIPVDEKITDITGPLENMYRVSGEGVLERYNVDNGFYKLQHKLLEGANPWPLTLTSENICYVPDLFKQTLLAIKGESVEQVADFKTVKVPFDTNVPNMLVTTFSIQGDIVSAVDRNHGAIFSYDISKSSLLWYRNSIHLSKTAVLFKSVVWICLCLLIVLTILLVKFIYVVLLNNRKPLLLKQLALFVPIFILSIVLITQGLISDYNKTNQKEQSGFIGHIASLTAKQINGDNLEALCELSDVNSPQYEALCQEMQSFKSGEEYGDQFDSYVYKVKEGTFYVFDSYGYDFFYPYKVQEAHREVFKKGGIKVVEYTDENGSWLSAVTAISNRQGIIVGVFELSRSLGVFNEHKREVEKALLQRIFISILLFLIAYTLLTWIITRTLGKLSTYVSQIKQRQYQGTVVINTDDEIGDLARGVNNMALAIQNHISHIESLNKSNSRFVPSDLLRYLGKTDITEISLGDQVLKDLTVLFSDIRSFTALSEKMTPKENFNFINSYLCRVGPIVRKHDGFIDKYIGDAVMALYPLTPLSAVESAIAMQREMVSYNQDRFKMGYEPISIGIGLHTGRCMLGIIGEEERLEGTVIADAVNLAARLEGLTKQYGVQIIASDDVLKCCAESGILSRPIDSVLVVGRNKAVVLHEVFAFPESSRTKKILLAWELYSAMRAEYESGNIEGAIIILNKMKSINEEDTVTHLYLERCHSLLKWGLPENWDGTHAHLHK